VRVIANQVYNCNISILINNAKYNYVSSRIINGYNIGVKIVGSGNILDLGVVAGNPYTSTGILITDDNVTSSIENKLRIGSVYLNQYDVMLKRTSTNYIVEGNHLVVSAFNAQYGIYIDGAGYNQIQGVSDMLDYEKTTGSTAYDIYETSSAYYNMFIMWFVRNDRITLGPGSTLINQNKGNFTFYNMFKFSFNENNQYHVFRILTGDNWVFSYDGINKILQFAGGANGAKSVSFEAPTIKIGLPFLSNCSSLPTSGSYIGQVYVCYDSNLAKWTMKVWDGTTWQSIG
jgi:hypothetical protein